MAAAKKVDEQQVLTFRVGSSELAAPAKAIAEIFRRTKLTRVPLGPPGLLGLTSLRGAVVPVISLAQLLGQEEAPVTTQSRILLLEQHEPVGIAVDAVGTLTEVRSSEIREASQASTNLFVQDKGALRVIPLGALIERDFARVERRSAQANSKRTAQPTRPPMAEALVLLSFTLAGQNYGLPLAEVAEVVAASTDMIAVPGAGDAMLGVIALRDGLLPVASLASLLGLRGPDRGSRGARIIVATLGNARVGFLVDRLNAILRTPLAFVDPVPAVLNRGAGEAQIQSICRLPNAGGLVSILSTERLFREGTIARILSDSLTQEDEMIADANPRSAEQILVFQLGNEDYGLPIGVVEEVVNMPDVLTRVPRAPAFVDGVINHRGKVLTIIDQRIRFGLEGRDAHKRRIIVTRVNEMQVGFVVDHVSEILSVHAEEIKAAPDLTRAEGNSLFDRIVTLAFGDRMILLIEPQELLNRTERDLLAAFASAAEGPVPA